MTRLALMGALAGAVALAGCAAPPFGPSVPVAPGPGKSFEAFQDDQAVCRSFAQGQVAGQADAANQRAVGNAVVGTVVGAGLGAVLGGGRGALVGAASGAGLSVGLGAGATAGEQFGIQARYDDAFAQCMYSRGNQVAGFAPLVGYEAGYYGGRSDLVRAVQVELNRLLLMKGAVDGVAGPQTVAAISKYERAGGLPVDGAASEYLLDRLRRTPAY